MRWVLKILICILAGLVLGASVQAIVPESTANRYGVIPERNVFGLRPPPAQPALTNPPAPLPKIILTGITTILDNKRALMKVQPAGVKPGETAKELSLILTEGQRENEIEVLQIDEKLGSVRVNNSGTIMTLTFEKDGAKLPAPTPVLPGAAGLPSPLPVAGAASRPYGLPATAVQQRRLPNRIPRSPGSGSPEAAGFTGAAAPVGGVPTPTGAPSIDQTTSAANQDLTAEEQAIVIELQRQANVNPSFPPLPPTPLTPNAAQSTDPGASATGTNLQFPARPPVLVPQ